METKPIWTSKTFWGAMITLASSALLLFGVQLTPDEQDATTTNLSQIAGGVGEIVGFILVIIGRYKATKSIG